MYLLEDGRPMADCCLLARQIADLEQQDADLDRQLAGLEAERADLERELDALETSAVPALFCQACRRLIPDDSGDAREPVGEPVVDLDPAIRPGTCDPCWADLERRWAIDDGQLCVECGYADSEHGSLCSEREPERENGGRQATGRVIVAESFVSIRAKPTRWLWDGRIPLGNVTMLVGREKLGKSTLTVELAARLSRGDLPGDLNGQPAGSLILSYEDSPASTIKPRLLAAGADLDHVRLVSASRDGTQDLVSLPDDVERIAELAVEHGARLLIVDPFSASLNGNIDNHRDQDVRRAIAPLVALAGQANLAVLVLAHWNKASGGSPLDRVLGSRGLTAAVRSVLAFGVSPDADEHSADRVLAHAASNLGPEAPSLTCRIEARIVQAGDGEAIPTSRLVIVGESDARAEDLLVVRREGERSAIEQAADWLEDELADGEWRLSRDLKAAANCSESTLKRAAKKLGVQEARRGFPAVTQWRFSPVGSTVSSTVDPTGADPTGETLIPAGVSTPADLQSGQLSETDPTEPSGGDPTAADDPPAEPWQQAIFDRHNGRDPV